MRQLAYTFWILVFYAIISLAFPGSLWWYKMMGAVTVLVTAKICKELWDYTKIKSVN